ncbi:MAG: PadR family transcriptional regulator [Chloroflexi bacterium]|nr:PadR family transcriptional regulator [Chloroflexota bacterium]
MSPMIRLPLSIEHALLGFLRQHPMHGYEIHQALREPSGLWLVWRLKQSQLYALLAKLEEEGFINSTLQPQAQGPTRRVYRLTAAGRQRFRRWVKTPVPHGREMRQEFLAKLFFAQREGAAVAKQLIEAQRATCREWLQQQQTQMQSRSVEPFPFYVQQYRIGQIKATLAWLNTCERQITKTEAQHET